MTTTTRAGGLRRASRRASRRVGTVALGVALVAAGAGLATPLAAQAAPVPADPGHTGLYGAASATYDGVYRQSLAILGLHAVGITPPAAAVTWLLDQQCADGGFSSFNPDPSQPCAPFNGTTYSGGTDTNATALAVQALLAVGDTAQADTAAQYLAGIQHPDGGWEYTAEDTTSASDPNSTGLVLTALNAAGITPTYDPAPYFAALQVGRTLPVLQTGDAGGITTAYSGGYADVTATPQVVPGLIGDDLLAVSTPTLGSWSADATPPTNPPATATGISDWAASWLAAKLEAGSIANGMKAWAVLSLAATSVGRTAAQDAYQQIATGVPTTDPGALGQAALAATALGETADAQRDATLIAATLTTAAGRDSAAPAGYVLTQTSAWTGQTETVENPYDGTDLPLTQLVEWGDGTTSPLTGLTATHAYTTAGTYTPTVRVVYTDTGYVRPAYVALGPVVVVAPSAELRLSRSSVWLGGSLTITPSHVVGAPTTSTVAWGDGTTSPLGSSATHVYRKAGTFAPKVTVTNGTGGTATLGTLPASVKVTKDTTRPTLTLTRPRDASHVSAWTTLRGTAKDSGSGLRSVTVALVEQRGGAWYSYDGSSWTKRSSLAAARSAARRVTVHPSGSGTWSLRVARLTKGSLVVTCVATDAASNVTTVTTTAKLTS